MAINESLLAQAHVYNDLDGLHKLKHADAEQKDKIQAVAKQFESMMLNLMLKSMRQVNQVFSEGNPLHSHATRFYEDMLDQQLSLTLTQGDGLGFATMLARQLNRVEEVAAPISGYRTLQEYRDNAFPSFLNDPESTAEPDENSADILNATEAALLEQVDRIVTDLFAPVIVESVAEPVQSTSQASPPDVAENLPLTFESPEHFLQSLYPQAQEVARELNVDPKLLLAQAALETGWGKHMILGPDAGPSFNLFGIKADQRWSGESVMVATSEFRNGIKLNEQAAFRAYQNYAESFRDYLNFLRENPRYQEVLNKGEQPRNYVDALQEAGYATDPDYANKIFRIYQGMDDFVDSADGSVRLSGNALVEQSVKAEAR